MKGENFMNENKNIATIEWVHAYLTNRGFSVESHPVTQQNVSYDISIRKNGFYRKERIYGLCNVSYEVAIQRLNRMIRDFEKDYCTREVSSTCPDRHSCSSYAFRRNGCIGCSEFEKEKNNMKNIAFDISRDGPVGKLVIKDNVYNISINTVNYNSSPNQSINIEADILGRDDLPKLIKETKNHIIKNIYGIKAFTTYNPDRKDSINEGKVQIKDVIFNPPATIVFWSDDSKTVVKAENERYDPEKGLAMAIAKRALGNQGNYFDTFKKYVDAWMKKLEEEFAKFAGAHADGTERIAEHKKPWKIFYECDDAAYEPAAAGVCPKEYVKKGNAIRAARKRFDGKPVRWMVAQENPWANGEWANCFGGDDRYMEKIDPDDNGSDK
jgi:hypothetical protein